METELKDLIGKKVKKIFLNGELLRFDTDGGSFIYEVTGDCCSSSYFYDFYGVKNLLEGGAVKDVKSVELQPTDLLVKLGDDDHIQVYGYQITCEKEIYGTLTEVTAVFSFRNSSNGYYGGSIDKVHDTEVSPEITEDVNEVK